MTIAILFDLDGTLVDSSEGILDSLRCMLDSRSLPSPSDDELRSWIGPPLQTCARELAGATTEHEVEQAVQAYRTRYREHGVFLSRPFDGIADLLERLSRSAKVRLGVATSKPTEFAAQIIEQHGFLPLLPVICGADWEGLLSKADLIQQAFSRLGADPEQSVMIGDRRYDIEGAQQHGLASIGVTYGFGDRTELDAAGADVVCESVDEVSHALDNFLQA